MDIPAIPMTRHQQLFIIKTEGMTHLSYTNLFGELEYLKTKTRLKDVSLDNTSPDFYFTGEKNPEKNDTR